MNNPYDHIEEFLAGDLSHKEHAQFERELLKDANLRDEVEMVREMDMFAQRKADSRSAIDVVKGVMEEGEKEEEENIKTKGHAKLITFIVAAAAAIAFTASFAVKSASDQITTQEYAADSILQLAQYSYNQSNFKQAIKLFTDYENLVDTINPEAQYFKSLALLGNKEPVKAIQNLDLIPDKSQLYENDIYWYKGLSKLLSEDYSSAKETLLKIHQNSVRKEDGKSLLLDLSQLTKEQ